MNTANIIIYEVNLNIKMETYEKNKSWLFEHIQEMVDKNQFIKVNVFHQLNLDPTDDSAARFHRLTAQYYIENYQQLENYLAKMAKNMRSQVMERLGDDYSVFRRVFALEKEINGQ